jgi:hypothetical protein
MKDQLQTITELKSLINIRMENDEGDIMREEEIFNNLIHCFQARINVDQIVLNLHKTPDQVDKYK